MAFRNGGHYDDERQQGTPIDRAVADVVGQVRRSTSALQDLPAVTFPQQDALRADWRRVAATHPDFTDKITALAASVIGGIEAQTALDPLTQAGIDATLGARGVVNKDALALLRLVVASRHHEQRIDYVRDAEAIVAGLRAHGNHGHRVHPNRIDLPMVVGAALRGEFNPARVRPARRKPRN